VTSHVVHLLVYLRRCIRGLDGPVRPMAHGRPAGQVPAVQEDMLDQHVDRAGNDCGLPPLIRPNRLETLPAPPRRGRGAPHVLPAPRASLSYDMKWKAIGLANVLLSMLIMGAVDGRRLRGESKRVRSANGAHLFRALLLRSCVRDFGPFSPRLSACTP
jgi:hypothetical protein